MRLFMHVALHPDHTLVWALAHRAPIDAGTDTLGQDARLDVTLAELDLDGTMLWAQRLGTEWDESPGPLDDDDDDDLESAW